MSYNPIRVSLALATADPDGISLSQTPGAAGNLTITGALASSGVATMDVARRLTITSGGSDESGKTFTFYGASRDGIAQSQAIAGPTASATVATDLDFKTATRVAVSAATTGAVTAGTNSVGSTQWFQREWTSHALLGLLVYIASGNTVNASVEITMDDPNAPLDAYPYDASAEHNSASPPVAVPLDDFTGLSASHYGYTEGPFFMFRMTINSGTDAAVFQAIESSTYTKRGY